MNTSRNWLWFLAIVAALTWWTQWHGRPVRHPAGVLVTDIPAQEALTNPVAPLRKDDVAIRPLATFSLSARVLARADYTWDREAKLAPIDLALGWGRMSDSAVLDRIDISQSTRFYFWQVRQFPIPEREIIESSANMHLIAADDSVARAIARTRVGDIVSFDGYLVEADWPDGGRWVSSLSRTDSGPGACELVWVENFSIAGR